MEKETMLYRNLKNAAGDIEYDEECKKILSEKIILAWIMKECLWEYKGLEAAVIANEYIEGEPQVSEIAVPLDMSNQIHGDKNEDVTRTEGGIYYDIRFRASAPSKEGFIRLILNVEAQGTSYTGYPLVKRGIYYGSRMISAQNGVEFKDSEYGKIKKIYSIWLCFHPYEESRNTIASYHIQEDVLFGSFKEAKVDYDLMTIIMVRLGRMEGEVPKILKLLYSLFSNTEIEEKKSILESEFEIPMTEKMERRLAGMCNLSTAIREEGREEGREEERKELALDLMDILDVETIAKKTKLSILAVKELAEKNGRNVNTKRHTE